MEAAVEDEAKALRMDLREHGPDELWREGGPGASRTRTALVGVSGRRGGYNFFYDMPRTGMPEYLIHEGTLLRRLEPDTGHPQCTVHRYETVTEAAVVPPGVETWVPGP